MKNILFLLLISTMSVFGQNPTEKKIESETESFINKINVNSSTENIKINNGEFIIETIAHDFNGEEIYNVRKTIYLTEISDVISSYNEKTNFIRIEFKAGSDKSILRTSKDNTEIIKNKSASISLHNIKDEALMSLVEFLKSYKNK